MRMLHHPTSSLTTPVCSQVKPELIFQLPIHYHGLWRQNAFSERDFHHYFVFKAERMQISQDSASDFSRLYFSI